MVIWNTHAFGCSEESCERIVVLPEMVREDLEALLEINLWRKNELGHWICDEHEQDIQGG